MRPVRAQQRKVVRVAMRTAPGVDRVLCSVWWAGAGVVGVCGLLMTAVGGGDGVCGVGARLAHLLGVMWRTQDEESCAACTQKALGVANAAKRMVTSAQISGLKGPGAEVLVCN